MWIAKLGDANVFEVKTNLNSSQIQFSKTLAKTMRIDSGVLATYGWFHQ